MFNPAFPATWEAMPASLLIALLDGLRVSQVASQRSIYSAFMGLIPNAHYSKPINAKQSMLVTTLPMALALGARMYTRLRAQNFTFNTPRPPSPRWCATSSTRPA